MGIYNCVDAGDQYAGLCMRLTEACKSSVPVVAKLQAKRKNIAEPPPELPFGLSYDLDRPTKVARRAPDVDGRPGESECSVDDSDMGGSASSMGSETCPSADEAELGGPERTGISGFERAPTTGGGLAKCFVCSACVKKGQYRLRYQLKPSTSLRDNRVCRLNCATRLPAATRKQDCAALRHLARKPGRSPEEASLLQELAGELKSSHEPSSASTGRSERLNTP